MQVFIEDVTDELGGGAPESNPVLWTALEVGGSVPAPRGGHSATLVGNRIIIWGGADRQQQYQPGVYALNLSTTRWEQLEAKGKAPDPRSGHSAVAWGEDGIVIYGGMSTVLEKFFGDCWLLQIKGADVTWSEPEACGEPALKRNSHSASLVSAGPRAGSMIVVGGGFEEGLKFNVQVADLNGLPARVTWTTITNASLEKMGGREMHAACCVGSKLLIFGGRTGTGETVSDELVTVDVASMQLLALDRTGMQRCGHAIASAPGTGAFVTGGIDMTGPFAYDDLLRFQLESQPATLEEREKEDASAQAAEGAGGGGTEKQKHAAEALDLAWSRHKPVEGESTGEVARFAHSSVVAGEKLYVLGGIDFEKDYNSVAVCSIAGPW